MLVQGIDELWNDQVFVKKMLEQQIEYIENLWKTHDRIRVLELLESAQPVLLKWKVRYRELTGHDYVFVMQSSVE